MTPEPPSAKSIFDHALDLASEAERAVYVDAACRGNPELRSRVDALLRAHAGAAGFLEEPALPLSPATRLPVGQEQVGERIGPYKLLQRIGEGGMGTVYMAEQLEPVRRKVALKIIQAGLGTPQIIARFEAERQALALMEHPGIAKILDAGTTAGGRPYFVMELVKGIPIVQYCDERRLSVKERLDLFVMVCQAVQHAHQKGVVHRDLKPGNVLVADYDETPAVKIIDFGVAKAVESPLTERTLFTEFGQLIGTIEYMSPEQAKLNQLDIDTRSDIYTLGVLLYELLSGEAPFDRQRLRSAAFDETLRIIREEEPPTPSTRLTSSPSLAVIAAKRRVEPRKLATSIAGDLDWVVMRAMEKDRTRRYESASALADDVQRFLADEPVLARRSTRLYLLGKLVRRHRVIFAAGGAVAAALLVGAIVATVAFVRERAAHAEAAAAQIKAHAETLRSEQLMGQLGQNLWQLAETQVDGGHRDEAEKIFRDAVRIFDQAVVDVPASENFRREQAAAELKLASFLGAAKRMDEAVSHYRSSIQKYAALKTEFPTDPRYPDEEINATIALADAHLGAGQKSVADPVFREAMALLRIGAEQGIPRSQDRLANCYFTGKGVPQDYAEALRWFRPAAEHGYRVAQNTVGIIYDQGLGVPSDPAEAARWYQKAADQGYNESKMWLGRLYARGRGVEKNLATARALYQEVAHAYSKTLLESDVSAVNLIAWQLVIDPEESLHDPETAVELSQKMVALLPNDGTLWNTLGVAQYRAGNWPAAITALRKSCDLRGGGNSYDYFFFAMAFHRLQQPAEARQWYDKGVADFATSKPPSPALARFRREAAELLNIQDK